LKLEINERQRSDGYRRRRAARVSDEPGQYEQIFHKVERRLRDPRVVTAISNAELKLDTKADFSDKANLQALYDVLVAAQTAGTEG
jgi:hypothetical protein